MPTQYVKRHQMAFDFKTTPLPPCRLPLDFCYTLWKPDLLASHADVKHRGFRNDSDAELFPTFRSAERCRMLMDAIASSRSFLPQATILIAHRENDSPPNYVAAIQGMKHSEGVGGIQNVAVVPEFRRLGLGKALVAGSLHGFRKAGLERVTLEVTADNFPAVRLYEGLGFKTFKIYFREIYPDR